MPIHDPRGAGHGSAHPTALTPARSSHPMTSERDSSLPAADPGHPGFTAGPHTPPQRASSQTSFEGISEDHPPIKAEVNHSQQTMASIAPVKPNPAGGVPQRGGIKRPASTDTERPAPRPAQVPVQRSASSAQFVKPEQHDQQDEQVEYEEEEYEEVEEEYDEEHEQPDDNDPSKRITPLDWNDLETRFHNAIGQSEANEAQLMREFNELMSFFHVWAEAGSQHETDRTFKRLKTRIAHVQHSEMELENKRLHHNKVVNAFQSALQLLSNS